jgi:ribosomal protein S18 acetylase RimI-like enzyme
MEAAGAPPRARARLGDIDVVDRGVGTRWSVQAYVPFVAAAEEETLRDAIVWCASRGGRRGFGFCVRAAERAALTRFGLIERDALPVYAMPAAAAADLDPAAVPEAEVCQPRDLTELVAAYGGWMDDLALAAGLLRADDLSSPGRRFLVCRVEGRPVGCALVSFAAGTAYLSGIGIVADARGRGYGRALTAAAAITAARGVREERPDLVWMHATDKGAALYERMGFHRVDVHVTLGP